MKVLLLGDGGLLGRDFKLFNAVHNKWEIVVIDPSYGRWPSQEFKTKLKKIECDLIINAVSSLQYQNRLLTKSIHYELPSWLVKNVNCKVILFSSDVVFQLKRGGVNEKLLFYAQIKEKMENDLKLSRNATIIRTSIIGLTKTMSNLMFKIFSLPLIQGHKNSFWSGLTTLQLYEFIANNDIKPGLIALGGDKVSLHYLLNEFNTTFSLGREVKAIELPLHNDRSFISDVLFPDIAKQIKELKKTSDLIKSIDKTAEII